VTVLLKSGNTERSNFHLTIGQQYIIYAMALWASGLGLLVLDDNEDPRWKEIELFDLADRRIPVAWEFAKIDDELSQVLALWGYPSLIRDPNHYDDLAEGKPWAMAEFLNERERRASLAGGLESPG
jgi:hypothetical protein